MKSICYITLLIGVATVGLSGCAEAPIAKTNCWVAATQTTVSSSGIVSRAAGAPSDLMAGSDDAATCE